MALATDCITTLLCQEYGAEKMIAEDARKGDRSDMMLQGKTWRKADGMLVLLMHDAGF